MQRSVIELLAVARLMNQCVGDAISGLLLLDTILRWGVTLDQWMDFYQDTPSRQTKLKVADRTVITTTGK